MTPFEIVIIITSIVSVALLGIQVGQKQCNSHLTSRLPKYSPPLLTHRYSLEPRPHPRHSRAMIRHIAPCALLLLAGCATPAPAPIPAPPPPVVMAKPAPPPLSADWRDWPVNGGSWQYLPATTGGMAQFAPIGGQARLILRCQRESRQLVLSFPQARTVPASGQIRLLTSYGVHHWPAAVMGDGSIATIRAAGDPGLDQMAFSRGRFAIDVGDGAPLVVPAWAEPARVVEECRG